MILILTATAAVFLAGVVIGVFAMVVIGIHAEQQHSARIGTQARTLTGAASRRLRLLSVRLPHISDTGHDEARR